MSSGQTLASRLERADEHAAGAKVRVLLVPGFVVDTYSSIEQSLVELSARPDPGLEFLWLVPEIAHRDNRFARPENRAALTEPVWVSELRRHGIPFVVGNISKYNAVANFFLFRKLFQRYPVDAVYTHFGMERFWTAFFGTLWGKTVIWHERWHSLGTRYVVPKRWFYRYFVDEFIAVSEFIKNTLPPDKRVRATIPGTRISSAAPPSAAEKAARRQELGIAPDDKVVIMVANFRAWKRPLLALEIAAQVLRQRQDVTFVFLGDGDERPKFLARVDRLGVAQRVLAPGYVGNVDDYYEIADIGMLTSHYEPFGNVVLESMRNSLPVVSFDRGGPAEMIRHGETGFLVPETDADTFARRILELVADEGLRTSLGARGRRLAEQEYSRERALERVASWIKEGVHERRRRGRVRQSGG